MANGPSLVGCILSCPGLSESGLSTWVAEAIGVLDRSVAGGIADALGVELAGPASAWLALVLLAVSLPLISFTLALRTRARRRRIRRELEAQLRQGVRTAAGRTARATQPPSRPAAADGTDAARAEPRVEASPRVRAKASPARAPRDVAQEVLLERIVTDAVGRALGGGKLAPPSGRPHRSTGAGSPAPREPEAADAEIPPCYRRASAGPAARRAPEERPPSRAPAARERHQPSAVTAMPRPVMQQAVSHAAESLPQPSGMAGRAPRAIPTAQPGPPPEPGSFERALAQAWSQAVRKEAAPTPPAETQPGSSSAPPPVARAKKPASRPETAFRTALAAHRAKPSRTTLTHLLRLATTTRLFRPGDGERLRRAVSRHPGAPVFLHAAGVFEATHGDRWAAIGLLRTALRLERDASIRGEISRELVRLEAPASGDQSA